MAEVGDAKGRRGFGEGGEQEGLEEQLLFVQKGRGQERNPGITEGLGMGGDLKSDPVPTGLIPSAKGWLLNSRAHQGFLLPIPQQLEPPEVPKPCFLLHFFLS